MWVTYTKLLSPTNLESESIIYISYSILRNIEKSTHLRWWIIYKSELTNKETLSVEETPGSE